MAVAKKKVTASKPKGSALARATAEVDVAKPREAKFNEGDRLICTVDAIEQPTPKAGKAEVLIVKFTICEGQPGEGEARAQVFPMSQKALSSTAPRIKAMAMALCNAESEEEYDAAYPCGEFVDGLLGLEEEVTAEQIEESQSYLGAAKVRVICTRGNDDDEGDYYRNVGFERVG